MPICFSKKPNRTFLLFKNEHGIFFKVKHIGTYVCMLLIRIRNDVVATRSNGRKHNKRYLFSDNTGVWGIGRDGGILHQLASYKTLPSD